MLKQFPFSRPLIFFVGGILLENGTHPGSIFWGSLGLASVAYWIWWGLLPFPKKVIIRYKIGLAICLVLLSFGGMHAASHPTLAPIVRKTDFQPMLLHLQEGKKTIRNGIRYNAQLYIKEKTVWINRGKVLCYLDSMYKNQSSQGDLILVKGQIEPVSGPSHPGGFDMQRWGALNGIIGQIRIRQNDMVMRVGKQQTGLSMALAEIRNNTIRVLQQNIQNPVHAGLAEAMLIGHKDDLDHQLMDAYTNTGVVHIIAISGMHLGLIFMLLDGMLVLMAGKRNAVRFGPFATLPVLWAFSILTGSSASIVRSAVMFSFLILAKSMKRKNRSMNALLGSAFLMIFHDAQVLSDIGFQLSYAAVGSILLFHRRIKECLLCIHPLTKGIWEMISLTLAAQILTTPLVIFHFHRFPLLFLFANLVAVPLSSLILLLEIVLIFSYPWEWLSAQWGNMTVLLIGWMNAFILRLDLIPWGAVKGIHLSAMMIVLISAFVFVLCSLALNPSRSGFLKSTVVICMIAVLHLWEHYVSQQTRKLVIMDIPRSTCILHQHGRKGILMIGGAWSHQPQKINRLLEETGVALGIRQWELLMLPDTPLVVRAKTSSDPQEQPGFVALALLHAIPLKDVTPLIIVMQGKDLLIISDASNSVWKSHEWEKQVQRLHLRFISNAYQGYVERRCACPNLK